MKKEIAVTIKDRDYEQALIMKDMDYALNCIRVFMECDFEVTIKIRDKKE